MLDKFHVCGRTDEQGVMRLTLPVGVAETEYEVVVVIAPKGPVGRREWPPVLTHLQVAAGGVTMRPPSRSSTQAAFGSGKLPRRAEAGA